MFLENQIFPDNAIDDERISRAINNDHTAAMKAPSDNKKHKKKGGSSSDMITVCMLCQKAFKSPAFYRKHLRLHAEKGRRHKHKRLKHQQRFQQQHQAGEGRFQHAGERPFACQLCPKSFCIKSSLQRHLSCHTGEKPFVCGLCQRGYTRRSVLALHVQQVHEARKPFQCDSCQLRFSQKGNLQAHFRRKHLPAQPPQGKGPKNNRGKRGNNGPLEQQQKRVSSNPPFEQKTNSSIHSYASKVKAIVSRGQNPPHQQKMRVVSNNSSEQQKMRVVNSSPSDQQKMRMVNSAPPEQQKIRVVNSCPLQLQKLSVENSCPPEQQKMRVVNSSLPEQQKTNSSIHSYASKVKAIVSRSGQQKRVRYPDPPPPPSLSSAGGSSEGEGCSSEGEGCFPAPLPDLESFLEGGRWEEFLLADTLLAPPYEVLPPKGGVLGGWTDDCPLFTAEDLDQIKEISGNIYSIDTTCIKTETLSELDRFHKPHTKGLA